MSVSFLDLYVLLQCLGRHVAVSL